ncbi:TetR/AcrR family transcriptional regulator [Petroclostridium sp. X23]|uniref:TetR/AcrR family transcriptional regulator n=1 Tax=Petroclostridium sp. X23 TaxID=3045146 RepID=UPI0024AE5C9C|nr:TetR/AcrR family transcriptional regulator [Petroclostridium sp. X23]WHH58846.1 TetR/AcrR family transcriptional regulator [Petroclostridium sp. X23]
MDKTKKSIFDAAIKNFSLSGYKGAVMDNIASDAGVAKGTLYYHFKSKEELFNFVIEEGITFMYEAAKEAIIHKDNPLEKLKIICEVQLHLLYKNRAFFSIIVSQLWGTEIRHSELRYKLNQYIRYISDIMQDAMDKDLIRKGNASFFAYNFFGNLISAALYEVLNGDTISIDGIIDDLIEYAFNGIALK